LSSRSQTGEVLRVLIFIDALGIGGKERQAVELIKGLAASPDVDILVICLENDDFYLHELTGISVKFALRRWRWDPGIFHKLYGITKHYRPNIIHTNGLMSSFYALPLARLMRIPLINGSIRNAFSSGGFRWTLEKLLLRLSDYRLANSYAGFRSRRLSERDSRNVVIYNGFDFSRLQRLRSKGDVHGNVGDVKVRTVGMVAEFNRFKDYSTFIQAARKISSRRKDVVFVLVGDGETMEASQREASGLEAIRFLGKKRDIEEIVETFDIGVLCTFVEGFSNAIMEYMALGKPVVATDGGGTRELVVHGETGFLVPPADPDAVAAKIEYLLDHPSIAKRFGHAAEARVRQKFSIARMVEETIRIYKVAIADSTAVAIHDDLREGSAQP
jgi:glycosyltransferase involved in cell wall biosynthesis